MPKDLNGPKSLDDIIPAKGVKIKRKKKIDKKKDVLPEQLRRIKKDVFPPPIEDLEPPTKEAIDVVRESNSIKDKLISNMKEFNVLMNFKTLPENKTLSEKNKEKDVLGNLISTAMEMENISPGEGFLALATLALRQGLSLRDAGNKLAYDIIRLNDKLNNIDKKIDKLISEEKDE